MQKNVLDRFEATAARYPDRIGIVDGETAVSFAQLKAYARSVGTALCSLVPQRGMVAVLCERQWEAIPGFLGALYAGACYVPLDKKMPQARLQGILSRLHPDAVLCTHADRADAPLTYIEDIIKTPVDEALLSSRRGAQIDLDPAYVIFTSGSTGTPKGIAVSHRGILDFTDWLTESCQINENTVLGGQSPFYFDNSQKSLMSMLTCGATLHLLPKKFFSFPILLTRYLNEHQVNTLLWATAAFHLVANSGVLEKEPPRYVHTVAVGGEALLAPQLRRWQTALPYAKFFNQYGPTEVSVDCAFYPIDRMFAEDEIIPIGKACPNMEILLLDEDLHPVPEGQIGEICVRGSGLALGYLDEPEKTDAAFVRNPLNPRFPELLYRTGDLARLGQDGNLYFAARKDDQIKHMGYRIELGEVERGLCAIPGVSACVCLFDRDADKIIAFCACKHTPDALVREARSRLPQYMLPNVWIPREALPLNANGKLDRTGLKEAYFGKGNQA